MEIAPGIHRVEAPLDDRFVCLYLLVGTESIIETDRRDGLMTIRWKE